MKPIDNGANFFSKMTEEEKVVFMDRMGTFRELMMLYTCALKEVTTKFEVLNEEFSVRYNRNPVENIKTRLKTPSSILDKLKRKKLPLNISAVKDNIFDVAGIRIICSFPEDIYTLADMLLRQDDIKLIKKKDYIKTPKENGYRSLHLIVQVPIFLTDRTEYMNVEVQFRTIAMDFWASIEHKVRYKKDIKNGEMISSGLKECADIIAKLDEYMENIHHYIDDSNDQKDLAEEKLGE